MIYPIQTQFDKQLSLSKKEEKYYNKKKNLTICSRQKKSTHTHTSKDRSNK